MARNRARAPCDALVAVAVLGAVAGCDRFAQGAAEPPRSEQRVVVRSFTEAASVHQIAAAPPYVFAATDAGLDRWDLAASERVPLALESGPDEAIAEALASGRVDAVAVGSEGRALWIARGETLGRYDVIDGTWQKLPPVPVDGLDVSSLKLAAAGDDAVWLGGAFGLVYADLDGAWSITDLGSPVTALHVDDGQGLWIGTERGFVAMSPEGEVAPFEDAEACAIESVRILAPSLGGGVLAVGDVRGKQRIAVVEDGRCRLFRASPDVRWADAVSSGDVLAVLTANNRLYVTGRITRGARQLDRDGMRLLALSGEARALAPDYRFRSVGMDVPKGARSLGLAEDEILIGTEELGIARIGLDSPGPARWLRRRSLAAGPSGLTVQCAAADDCLLATGTRQLWRFDGERVRAEPRSGRAILALVRSARGALYALRRGDGEGTIEVAEREDDGWRLVDDLVIELPGADPELSFARVSPTGMLWLGLRYHDNEGVVRPHGVALVDLSLGVVAYHRATRDAASELDRGVLPIPINAIGVSFAGVETWVATSEGAAAVRDDGTVKLFTESHGLRSELLRGIAVNPGGTVFVATRAGVGVYDGAKWLFPRALRYSVRALEFADDGRLWMATDRGLAAYDGQRVRRLDARRGLLEDELRDLALDDFGRVWVRGVEGVTLVAP